MRQCIVGTCGRKTLRNLTMAKLTGFQHFLSALGYSVSGLQFAFNESAVRQEICVGILHVISQI